MFPHVRTISDLENHGASQGSLVLLHPGAERSGRSEANRRGGPFGVTEGTQNWNLMDPLMILRLLSGLSGTSTWLFGSAVPVVRDISP